MKLTGSIVTYNNQDTIEACVASVLEYTKTLDFKLYVVDNGSTDHTLELLAAFPQITVIQQSNKGFGAGHNTVLPILNSDYHFVINPDIEVDSAVFDQLAEQFSSLEDAVMLTPQVLNADRTIQYLPRLNPSIRYVFLSRIPGFKYLNKQFRMVDYTLNKPKEILFCTGCFFVIKTHVFKEVKGFDEQFFMYYEDADLSRRIQAYGKIYLVPQVEIIHLWERDNTKSMNGIKRYMNSLLKYFKKWGWTF